jgi:AraC-like DNA-binding protein
MNDYPQSEQDLLKRITEIAESNLTDGQFGVSELARELGMSRSNLHRKVSRAARRHVGDEKSALTFLQKALEDREMEGSWLISDPQYISLHSNNVFKILIQKVGFNRHS